MSQDTFHWLDVQRIAAELADIYPDIDPLKISFPRLKELVESLPGFQAQPDHPSNERILEAVQLAWIEEAG
jgi:FeS assembly protein IscX